MTAAHFAGPAQVCPTAPCGQVLLIVPPLALRGDGLELGVNIAGSKLAPGVAGPVKGSKVGTASQDRA